MVQRKSLLTRRSSSSSFYLLLRLSSVGDKLLPFGLHHGVYVTDGDGRKHQTVIPLQLDGNGCRELEEQFTDEEDVGQKGRHGHGRHHQPETSFTRTCKPLGAAKFADGFHIRFFFFFFERNSEYLKRLVGKTTSRYSKTITPPGW